VRSYTFRVRLEEDAWPGEPRGYFVCVPELEHLAAATHGGTPQEALANMQEVLQMVHPPELQGMGSSPPD